MSSTRSLWVGVMDAVARPVLSSLARDSLKQELPVREGKLNLTFRGFEVKTLRLRLK